MKTKFRLWLSITIILASFALFIFPAITIVRLTFDSALRETGQSRLVPYWFRATAGRFRVWAKQYRETGYAADLDHTDVAPTEWPMFGSVFFLVTAESLLDQGYEKVIRSARVQGAIEEAALIVSSPVTAAWVRAKWGESYLEEENLFYRMLLIMGLSSYQKLTGRITYHPLMTEQRHLLAEELSRARLPLLDDYPGECYPSDVLWAVAALQRAARLEGENHDDLARRLMRTFDTVILAPERLPAFQVDAQTGTIFQNARGCGNSGILMFSAELDPEIAARWYAAYAENFWQESRWLVGFREWPHGVQAPFMDVDSGPSYFGIGSVASAFGIGAAKTVGRLDHAVPLTIEAVAVSWPTPFGFAVPGLMGWLAAESSVLGEVALLFAMTRPMGVDEITPFTGHIPLAAWLLAGVYLVIGLVFIGLEIRYGLKRGQRGR